MDAAILNNRDPISAFQEAMTDAGVIFSGTPIADGNIHRFKVEGDRNGKKNGWYILFIDGVPAGAFGNWKTGLSETWCTKSKDAMTLAENQALQKCMKQARQERKKEQSRQYAKAKEKAKGVWQAATTDPSNHPYLKTKQINPYGIRQRGETLVIPLRDSESTLQSLQFIDSTGNKRFLTGGRVKGCYSAIGEIKGKMYICEGFATGATIHETTGEAVAVAFNTGNLKPVSKALMPKYPDIEIVICADNDQWTLGNPGISKGQEAAISINAKIAKPEFQDTSTKPTDFNDLFQLEGTDVVIQQLGKAAYVLESDNGIGDTPSLPAIHDTVIRLATLTPVEYDQVRKQEAKALKEA